MKKLERLTQKCTNRSHLLGFLLITLTLLGCESPEAPIEKWQHSAVGSLDATLSDDGEYAVVSSVNHGVSYWKLATNEQLFQWRHSDNPEEGIIASDISPDGSRVITADRRNFVIWNANNGQAYGYWQAPDVIRSVAIAELGRFVLLWLNDGRVIFIAMETGRRVEFVGHRKEPVASVDISSNGLWAFSGGNDRRAVLWNTQTGQPKYVFEHDTRVTQVKLARTGELAFSSGTRGNANIWDLSDGSERAKLKLKPREYVISSAAFSHDLNWLATGAPGRDVSMWSTQTGELARRWQASTREQRKPSGAIIWSVAFTDQDRYVLSASSAGFAEKWSVQPPPKS